MTQPKGASCRTCLLSLPLMAALLGACSASYPEGRIACSSNAECPGDFICRLEGASSSERFCYRGAGVSTSSPSTDRDAGTVTGPARDRDGDPGSPDPEPSGRDGGPDGRAGTTPDAAAGTGGGPAGGSPAPCTGTGCALRLVDQGVSGGAQPMGGEIRLVAHGFAPREACTGDVCVEATIR